MALTDRDIERIGEASGQACQLKHEIVKASIMTAVDAKINKILEMVQLQHDNIQELSLNAKALKTVVVGPDEKGGIVKDVEGLKTAHTTLRAWAILIPIGISLLGIFLMHYDLTGKLF